MDFDVGSYWYFIGGRKCGGSYWLLSPLHRLHRNGSTCYLFFCHRLKISILFSERSQTSSGMNFFSTVVAVVRCNQIMTNFRGRHATLKMSTPKNCPRLCIPATRIMGRCVAKTTPPSSRTTRRRTLYAILTPVHLKTQTIQ